MWTKLSLCNFAGSNCRLGEKRGSAIWNILRVLVEANFRCAGQIDGVITDLHHSVLKNLFKVQIAVFSGTCMNFKGELLCLILQHYPRGIWLNKHQPEAADEKIILKCNFQIKGSNRRHKQQGKTVRSTRTSRIRKRKMQTTDAKVSFKSHAQTRGSKIYAKCGRKNSRSADAIQWLNDQVQTKRAYQIQKWKTQSAEKKFRTTSTVANRRRKGPMKKQTRTKRAMKRREPTAQSKNENQTCKQNAQSKIINQTMKLNRQP